MVATTTQKNKEGHNIAGDYIGGDKINSLIGKIKGDNNITKISVLLKSNYKPSKDDTEKFESYMHTDKIPEFKNLIDRIVFLCDLGKPEEAKKFISEANCISHNHPFLLNLNGYCEYVTLDLIEVIRRPQLIQKTIKLVEKAREVDMELASYYNSNQIIAKHFFKILSNLIELTRDKASHRLESYRSNDYYKAIAKHLIHFENCYRIHNDSLYIKEFVLHLSGYRDYPWFNLLPNGETQDFGAGIFEGGAINKLDNLVKQILALDPSYTKPELNYGDYFTEPQPRDLVSQVNKKVQIIFYSILTAVVIGISVIFLYVEMDLTLKIILVVYPIILGAILHPYGNRKSMLQRFSSFLIRKLTNFLSRRHSPT